MRVIAVKTHEVTNLTDLEPCGTSGRMLVIDCFQESWDTVIQMPEPAQAVTRSCSNLAATRSKCPRNTCQRYTRFEQISILQTPRIANSYANLAFQNLFVLHRRSGLHADFPNPVHHTHECLHTTSRWTCRPQASRLKHRVCQHKPFRALLSCSMLDHACLVARWCLVSETGSTSRLRNGIVQQQTEIYAPYRTSMD